MKHIRLEFNFTDYTSYKELKATIDGNEVCVNEKGLEFLAFQKAVCNEIKVSKITANINRSGYKDEDKLKLIEFDTFVKNSLFETKGLVGVVQADGIRVENGEGDEKRFGIYDIKITIVSRFDRSKPYFLSRMLSYENPHFFDKLFVESGYESLFTFLLIYIYKKQLIDADKQGLFKTYQRFERNDDKARGSIDVFRHMKDNMLFNGRIAYNCRENTFDNTLNHLILFAYDHLKKLFPKETNRYIDGDSQVRAIINRIKEYAQSYIGTNLNIVLSKSLRPVSHPYYQKYRALQKTCIRILRSLGVTVFNGNEEPVYGILFYIPDLWENFLTYHYSKFFPQNHFYTHTQFGLNIFSKSKEEAYRKKIRPDFVFTKDINGESPFFVLDAKFKPKWYEVAAQRKTLNEVFDDYLQIINYMVSLNAKAAGAIFPSNEGELDICEFDISKFNTKNKFYCCCLFVPEGTESYSEWVRDFDKRVKSAFEKLRIKINVLRLLEE